MTRQRTHERLVAVPVADVMSQPVRVVSSSVLLGEVLTAMLYAGVRHVAVVDDHERCLGVVGDRSVAAAWAADPTALERTRVGRVLERRPSVVGTQATVGDVARAMYVDAVDAVAVIDRAGHPVGMITVSDLVRLLAMQASDVETDGDTDAAPARDDYGPAASGPSS